MNKSELREMIREELDEAQKEVGESDIKKFVKIVQQIHDKYFAKHYDNLTPPKIEYTRGKKYYKIIRVEQYQTSRSVHSFVDRTTGDIHKPAGWKAPAKHARGNIFDNDGGKSSMKDSGSIVYMR